MSDLNLIHSGDTVISVVMNALSVAAAATVVLATGVPGKRFKLLALVINPDSTVEHSLVTDTTVIFQQRSGNSNAPPCPFNPLGWATTAVGEDLGIRHTSGSTRLFSGVIQYVLV